MEEMPEVIDFTAPERVMSSRGSRGAKRSAWTHTGVFEKEKEEDASPLSVRGLSQGKKEEKKNVRLEHFQTELKTALALEARGHAIESRGLFKAFMIFYDIYIYTLYLLRTMKW